MSDRTAAPGSRVMSDRPAASGSHVESRLQLGEEDLQAIIEDHDRQPRHFGEMDGADQMATGYNPVCGDRYDVYVRLDEDRIVEIRFKGFGCAISKASSSMMTEVLAGCTRAEALDLIEEIHGILTRGGALPEGLPQDFEALLGVRRYPGRIKCVTLGWHSARAALRGETVATTE